MKKVETRFPLNNPKFGDEMKILIVDDDPHILQLLSIHLRKEGYHVITAENAEQALQRVEKELVNIAVLDVMMPGMNGFELAHILTSDLQIPVILLTAKGQLEDKEQGFKSGADDYLVKPFEPKELLFRIAAILRRSQPNMAERIEFSNILIDKITYEVIINGQTIILPMKEFDLLAQLASRANKTVTRSTLIEEAWGEDTEEYELTLNTHMNRLRERLRKHGAMVEVHTVRGVGYRLEGK